MVVDRSRISIAPEAKGKKTQTEAGYLLGEEQEILPADDQFRHSAVFIENIRARKEPETNPQVGQYATNLGHLMNISWEVGHSIHWDGEKEQVIGDVENWRQANRESARAFWSKSHLSVSDPLVENLWYETLHARRCAYRQDTVPPGLFLPSTVPDYSHWHGDYHTNYNFQEPFWGDYTANHVDLGDAYFQGMKYLLRIGRKIARDYYDCRGAFIQLSGYPIDAKDDPLGVAPMGRMAYMTGWAMNQYWWRYLYTLDKDWLRRTGYPVIRDCALFYTDFLRKGEDGLYHAFPSNQGEDGFTGDPKDYTDRAQVMQHVRYCLRAAPATQNGWHYASAKRRRTRPNIRQRRMPPGHKTCAHRARMWQPKNLTRFHLQPTDA